MFQNSATGFPVLPRYGFLRTPLENEMKLGTEFSLSDKLVIGQHVLLFAVNTEVRPAWSVFAHRPNPIQEGESRCFQQNHKSMSYSVSGRITVFKIFALITCRRVQIAQGTERHIYCAVAVVISSEDDILLRSR